MFITKIDQIHVPLSTEDKKPYKTSRLARLLIQEQILSYSNGNAMKQFKKNFRLNIHYPEADAPLSPPTIIQCHTHETFRKDVAGMDLIAVPDSCKRRSLVAIIMDGEEMTPIIRPGAYVMLDLENKHIRSGAIYGVHIPVEGLVIRRINFDSGKQLYRVEANKPLPSHFFPAEEMAKRIIGRAVCIQQAL